jgi:predicted ester cyclase
MSESEQLFRRLIEEGFNGGDLTVAEAVTSPDLAEHQDFGPHHAPGAEGVRAVISSLRRAFSDFHLEIEDIAVSGDTVWARMTATGTHDGPFMGHPPTGRRMRATVFDAIRVADGRMVEHWGVPDRLSVLYQLEIVPRPVPRAA